MLVRPLACLIGLGFVVLSGCSAEQSGMSDSGASIDAAAVDAAAGVDASVRDAAARDAFLRDAGPASDGALDATIMDAGADARRTCNDIRSEHSTLLARALLCDPLLTVVQCTAKVERALGCGCQVFVNQSSAAGLNALADEWNAAGCTAICPLALCPEYNAGVCSSATSMCEGRP